MSAADLAGRAPLVRAVMLRRTSARLVVAALVVASASFAYFGMFRQFQSYDDEGYLMVAVQHLLDGHRLYDDIVMVYGPGYFAYRWLIHGLCGLPLGNDVVRLTSIAMWLASAALYGVVAHRLCKSSKHAVPLALIATAFTVFHLRALALEPGHPQELATGLVAASLCVAALAFARRSRAVAFCHGLVAGMLVLVKVNLGAFFAAASLLAWVVDAPRRKAWGLGALILGGSGALLLSFVLLRARFQDAPAVILCVVVTCALGVSLSHAMRSRTDAQFGLSHLVLFTMGAGVSAIVCLTFIVLHGSSVGSVFHSLFVASRRFATEFMFTFRTDWKTLTVCAASSVCGLALLWGRRWAALGSGVILLALVKAGFGVLVFYACVRDVELLVKYGTPWTWLVLVVPGRTLLPTEAFLRRLVCFTAALSVLQVFPVPGSQVNVGTAPLLLIAAACVADALHVIELRATAPRSDAVLGAVVWLASASVVGVLGWRAVEGRQAYRKRSSMEFAGCRLTRVPQWQAVIYRWLVDNLKASSDTFLSMQGQNSLYSWTGRKPASSVIVSTAWNLFNEEQNRDLIEAHRARRDVIVVENQQAISRSKREDFPFARFVDEELTPFARVAQCALMMRKGRNDVALVGCAWSIESDPSDPWSEPLPPAVARQARPSASMRALRLSIPPGRIQVAADKIELVDIRRGTILGSSASPTLDHRVQLFDASGAPLLPGRVGGATPAELCDTRGGFVLLPESTVLQRAEFPGLRFSKGGERLLTLPIAQVPRRR